MKALLYSIIVILIFFLADLAYVRSGLYDEDIKKCNAELIYRLDSAAASCNMLYFGESSNFTYGKDADSCRTSIAELLGHFNADYKIGVISKGAIYAPSYNCLIHRLPENSGVKLIVLTINLRSFGINWRQSDLETNLSRANVLYTNYPPVIKKLMLSFKMYDNRELFKRKDVIKQSYKYETFQLPSKKYSNVRDWDKVVFHEGISDASGHKDQAKTELACHFIKNFAFQLTDKNPNIESLDDIVEFCKRRNIKLVFHVLPENFENARSLCGEDLEVLMRQNALFLKNRYSASTVFVDNFGMLNNEVFIDKNWPTEHYYCQGRYKIASTIHEAIKAINE